MRVVPLALLFLSSFAGASSAQVNARSLDYLFLTNVSDARALWVNPAGMAVLPEASILGELVMDRSDGDLRVSQYTVGLNSRGFALGVEHDRFLTAPSITTVRLGTAVPFSRGTFGVGFSFYRQEGSDSRDVDVGIMYGLTSALTTAGVIRHIGRPSIAGVEVPITLAGGAQLSIFRGSLQIAAEAQATERRETDESGYDTAYRGGLTLIVPTSRPIRVITALDLGSNLRVDRWHFGLAVGGRGLIALVGTAVRRDGNPSIERVSAAGLASNILTGR